MIPRLILDSLTIGMDILMYITKYFSSTIDYIILKANFNRIIQIRILEYQKEN